MTVELSRRVFLTSVSMLAAGGVLPSPLKALMKEGEKLKIALVGTGVRGISFWGRRLVEEYSDDAHSAKRGGILPPLRAGQTVAEFEEAAFRLRPGEVSDVVETVYGFHVIKRIR